MELLMSGGGASRRYRYMISFELLNSVTASFVAVLGIHFMLIGFPICWHFQLGANAILAVSLAVCKAGAAAKKIPLYKVCDVFQ